MIKGKDWHILSSILYQLYCHSEGLTTKDIAGIMGYSPMAIAKHMNLLEEIGAYVGLLSDEEDPWDEKSDYLEHLAQSSQLWYISDENKGQLPVEFEVAEMMVLAQLAQFAGHDDLASKISNALGQEPGITGLKPSWGEHRDRHWDLIASGLQEERIIYITLELSGGILSRRKTTPLALVHNRDTGFWYFICLWRKNVHQIRLDKIADIEMGELVLGGLPTFDAEQYFDGSWGLMRGKKEKVEAIFLDQGRVLAKGYSRVKDRSNAVWAKGKDGNQQYSDIIAGVDEMIPWLRAFGSSVIVKKPVWVRQKLLEEAKKISSYYRDDESKTAGSLNE